MKQRAQDAEIGQDQKGGTIVMIGSAGLDFGILATLIGELPGRRIAGSPDRRIAGKTSNLPHFFCQDSG